MNTSRYDKAAEFAHALNRFNAAIKTDLERDPINELAKEELKILKHMLAPRITWWENSEIIRFNKWLYTKAEEQVRWLIKTLNEK